MLRVRGLALLFVVLVAVPTCQATTLNNNNNNGEVSVDAGGVAGDGSSDKVAVYITPRATATEMAVTWVSYTPLAGSYITFGFALTGTDEDERVEGAPSQIRDERETEQYIYTTVLEKLTPGDVYVYQVSSSTGPVTEIGSFRASPENGDDAREFVVVGDLSASADAHAVVAALVDEIDTETGQRPDAWLHPGDFAYAAQRDTGWVGYDSMVHPFTRSVPLIACPGNHEFQVFADADTFFARNPPPSKEAKNLYHSFNYGPVHVVVLSTGSDDITEVHLYEVHREEQKKWLADDLYAAVRNRAKVPWIVVLVHHPPYSTNHHGSFLSLRTDIEPLLVQYSVDLVISGHDHGYQRSHPLMGERDPIMPDAVGLYVNPSAPIYAVVGTGGYNMHEEFDVPPPTWVAAEKSGSYGYAGMSISEHSDTHVVTLKWEFRPLGDSPTDVFEIQKTPFEKNGRCGYLSCVHIHTVKNGLIGFMVLGVISTIVLSVVVMLKYGRSYQMRQNLNKVKIFSWV